jgi:hypothetical protein
LWRYYRETPSIKFRWEEGTTRCIIQRDRSFQAGILWCLQNLCFLSSTGNVFNKKCLFSFVVILTVFPRQTMGI